MSTVFLAMPLYDGRSHFSAGRAAYLTPARNRQAQLHSFEGSLIADNCTRAWAQALNARDEDPALEWFAMLHDDIQPQDWWLDTLIALAEQHGADFVSAVAPVKNQSGRTSTAIMLPGSNHWRLHLTQSQVNHPDFPLTFGAREAAEALARLPEPLRVANVPGEVLLANTGCMVCRLDRTWCDQVWFDNRIEMVKVNGKRMSVGLSEDWFFTKAIAEHGGKVMATRLVPLVHHGREQYRSDQIWGQPRHDV